jgi:hypothetical protein
VLVRVAGHEAHNVLNAGSNIKCRVL